MTATISKEELNFLTYLSIHKAVCLHLHRNLPKLHWLQQRFPWGSLKQMEIVYLEGEMAEDHFR